MSQVLHSAFAHSVGALSAEPSRRRALRLLAGSALACLLSRGPQPIEAKKKKKKKRKKSRGTDTPSPVSPLPPPRPPVSAYQCPGPSAGSLNGAGNARFAQTFTPSQSGALRQIQFDIFKESPPDSTADDYIVQLLAVSGGTPGSQAGDILAQVTIPDAAVPVGDSTLVADFPSGPALTAGTEFAAAITRPGANTLSVHARQEGGTACTGQTYIANGAGAFAAASSPALDLVVDVVVV